MTPRPLPDAFDRARRRDDYQPIVRAAIRPDPHARDLYFAEAIDSLLGAAVGVAFVAGATLLYTHFIAHIP